jgi:hypothetical protein
MLEVLHDSCAWRRFVRRGSGQSSCFRPISRLSGASRLAGPGRAARRGCP